MAAFSAYFDGPQSVEFGGGKVLGGENDNITALVCRYLQVCIVE
jgi:hypothetical protein